MNTEQAEWLFGGKLEESDLFEFPRDPFGPEDCTGAYDFCVERDGRLIVVELCVYTPAPAFITTPEEIEPFSMPRPPCILEAGQWHRK